MSGRRELYERVPASSLVLGDVLVEPCTTVGHVCEGMQHERVVREIASDPQLVLTVTQNDSGELVAEVMTRATWLHILWRPKRRRPIPPLSKGLAIAPILLRLDGARVVGPVRQ